MWHKRISSIRSVAVAAALAATLVAVPVAAGEPLEASASIVAGEIVLPEDATPLPDSTILVTVEDTRRQDTPSGILASLTMAGSGARSPVPFSLSVVPAVLDAAEVTDALDIMLRVRIESSDGAIVYVNDVEIAAVTPSGPITDLEVPVVAAPTD